MLLKINIKTFVLCFGVVLFFQSKAKAQVFGDKINPADYQYSMNITGAYFTDCEFEGNLEDSVAAFVGTELRGVAAVTEMNNAKFIAFLTIFSNNAVGENLTFKYYEKATATIIDLDVEVAFKEGNILGGRLTPFRLYKGDKIVDPVISFINDSLYIEEIDPTFNTYQWYDTSIIDGANSSYYKANDHGDYYVEVRTLQGCKVVSNTITYSPVGFDEEINKQLDFSVYPNPCNTTATVNTSLFAGSDIIIKLVGNKGIEREILTVLLKENFYQLNLENIPSGRYTIIIQSVSMIAFQSIIIQ